MSCQLCGSDNNLSIYLLKPNNDEIKLCETCRTQIEEDNLDPNHFNCLADSMWSEDSAVKILSYRLLKKLGRNDLIDMLYFDEAEEKIKDFEEEILKDAYGNILKTGDSVTVIKDLDVKGTGKTIKRGTTVKNIKMSDVEGHVACKVDGIGNIYLKAEFLKKI